MALTLAEKIIQKHIVPGSLNFKEGEPIERGTPIAIKIDQTLTQDATGTMAYLQFETIGVPRVKTEVSVSYIDHNTLQTDFKNHLTKQSNTENRTSCLQVVPKNSVQWIRQLLTHFSQLQQRTQLQS